MPDANAAARSPSAGGGCSRAWAARRACTGEHGSASNGGEHDGESGNGCATKESPALVAHILDGRGLLGKIAFRKRVVCHTYTCDPLPPGTPRPLSLFTPTI